MYIDKVLSHFNLTMSNIVYNIRINLFKCLKTPFKDINFKINVSLSHKYT